MFSATTSVNSSLKVQDVIWYSIVNEQFSSQFQKCLNWIWFEIVVHFSPWVMNNLTDAFVFIKEQKKNMLPWWQKGQMEQSGFSDGND